MDIQFLADTYDKFHNYLALNSSDKIITGISNEKMFSGGGNRVILSIAIQKRNMIDPSLFMSSDIISDLKYKKFEAWDEITAHKALAICAAIKHFNESSSATQEKGTGDAYCLRHVITAYDRDPISNNAPVVAMTKSYADEKNKKYLVDSKSNVIKSVKQFDLESHLYSKSDQANICLKIVKSAIELELGVKREWMAKFLPLEVASVFNVLSKAKKDGGDREEIKKAVNNILNSKNLNFKNLEA